MKSTDYLIAELAERSPIIIQNSSNPSSRKNLDVRPYDRTTVQGATFNMRGQPGTPKLRLYSVVQWSVHWAPGRATRVLFLAGARCCALETCERKNASSAFKLGVKTRLQNNNIIVYLRPARTIKN